MVDAAGVASTLTEVREVIETYRRFEFVVANWSGRLTAAAAALRDPVPAELQGDAAQLVANLDLLINAGLPDNPDAVDRAAHLTSDLLDKLSDRGTLGLQSGRLAFPALAT